jgi:hypothetical protein
MTQDRVDSGSLHITHNFLATMLRTDRPIVTVAAGVLQKKELIKYARGAVKIVNRRLRLRTLRGYPAVRWRAGLAMIRSN